MPMKLAERIVMVALVVVLIGGGAWIYFSVNHKQQEIKDAVLRGDYEIRKDVATEVALSEDEYFKNLVPLRIGETKVEASVADSMSELIQGLSDTPYLPQGVVKLFVFSAGGEQAIWMKDMQYALDIMWADKEGKIIYIKENVTPENYPNSFSSPKPAWYVIEANAGFVASSSIKIGDSLIVGG